VQLFRGRDRTLHPRHAALASHHTFAPKFCLPAKGNEKPRVENRVYDLERRWATPVPRAADLAALNAHLCHCCLSERGRVSGAHPEAVGVRFERDRAAALAVPAHRFDACVLQPGQVDKYQTVRFDHNSCSVPRRWAFRPVTIKGYVERVEVVADGQVVARHARSYGQGERVLDPLHYLVTLECKPAALDHAPVYRDWQLPAAFAELRQAWERRLGPRAGARQFIRVLRLLARHPVARVEQAIRLCRGPGDPDAAAVAAQAERLAQEGVPSSDIGMSLKDVPMSPAATMLSALRVPAPNLARFDSLLSRNPRGDPDDDPTDCPAAQGRLEAAQVADHRGRVGEAGPRGRGPQ
jgi:hypothetical protein